MKNTRYYLIIENDHEDNWYQDFQWIVLYYSCGMIGNFNFNNKQFSFESITRHIESYIQNRFFRNFHHGIQSYLKYLSYIINFLLSKISSKFFTKKFESFEKESIFPRISFLTLLQSCKSNHIAFDIYIISLIIYLKYF